MYRTTLTVGLYPAMVHAIIYANWCSEVDIGYDYCGQRYYPLLFHGCLDISHGWHQVELDNNNGNITAVGNTCDIHLKYILSKFGTWNMILAAQQIHIKNTRPSMVNKLVQQFVIYMLDPAIINLFFYMERWWWCFLSEISFIISSISILISVLDFFIFQIIQRYRRGLATLVQ